MIQIPAHIKTSLKLLTSHIPVRLMKQLLPKVLNNIEETGQECVKLANHTKNRFSSVMRLIGEVIEVTTVTQSRHEDQIKKNEREIAVLHSIENGMRKEEEFSIQRYKEATDAANRAEEIYYSALREIPTGLDAVLNDFSRGMLNLIPTVIEGMLAGPTGMAIGAIFKMTDDTAGSMNTYETLTNDVHQPKLSVSHRQTLLMSHEFAKSLQSFIKTTGVQSKNRTLIKGYVTTFETFERFLKKLPENPIKTKAVNIIERAKNFAINASLTAKKTSENDENQLILFDRLTELAEELKPIQTAAELTDPNLSEKSISELRKHQAYSTADSSKNELFKAQLAQVNLVEMKRFQDQQAAAHLALLSEMRKLSSMMVSINFTTLHYKEVIAMLEQVLQLFGRVRTQWNEFVLFFTDISVRVKNMVRGPLRRFLQLSRSGKDASIVVRKQLINMLKDDTYGIHRESYILFIMSRTYYDVSNRYLMSRLASLSNMLTAKDDEERSKKMSDLETNTNATIDQVEELVRARKADFDIELGKRQNELTALITKLGGIDSNNQKAIVAGQRLVGMDIVWSDK